MQLKICRDMHFRQPGIAGLCCSVLHIHHPKCMSGVDKSKVAATIRSLRKRAGLTQLQLGQRVDDSTGQNLVSRWESGRELPSVEKVTKLATALHTTTDHILTGEVAPTGGDAELHEFQLWVRTMAPNDLTEHERSSLAAIRWPENLGLPDPEWYDDALTMLRGVGRKAARRRRGPAH